jgi:hypothetical protein
MYIYIYIYTAYSGPELEMWTRKVNSNIVAIRLCVSIDVWAANCNRISPGNSKRQLVWECFAIFPLYIPTFLGHTVRGLRFETNFIHSISLSLSVTLAHTSTTLLQVNVYFYSFCDSELPIASKVLIINEPERILKHRQGQLWGTLLKLASEVEESLPHLTLLPRVWNLKHIQISKLLNLFLQQSIFIAKANFEALSWNFLWGWGKFTSSHFAPPSVKFKTHSNV